MAVSVDGPSPVLPFPIFRISSAVERYFLYDNNVITWLRKTHHILGVLIGTLPQIPQQNVFLGLPLELMPEEARLLCEKGLAHTVDDLEWHQLGTYSLTSDERNAFMRDIAREGGEAAKAAERKKLESTERAMRRLRLGSTPDRDSRSSNIDNNKDSVPNEGETETLFPPATPRRAGSPSISESLEYSYSKKAWSITPATALPPLPTPSSSTGRPLPNVKASSYALFKHLHAHHYNMSPGLRFGCQFLVYPGDPLRFHSHFLAIGMDWDEEIDLLDLIGGGRLGTGVKKGWLIGGVEARMDDQNNYAADSVAKEMSHDRTTSPNRDAMDGAAEYWGNGSVSRVRTFCIEWGGM
ncbi:tRNA-splicing endonuclease subunit [Xylographa bjoerkii]|nr:tRNA-splicing endonuclease subunit [Xylographa bjoerkii]